MKDEQLGTESQWEGLVKGILKAELRRRGKTYASLVSDLSAIGITETEANIKNKLSRGRFSAIFFIQCLTAIGVPYLQLDEVKHYSPASPKERSRLRFMTKKAIISSQSE